MLVDFTKVKIFLMPGVTDMRKAANELSVFVQEQMELDPFSGNLFLFCSRRLNIFKGLYCGRNGFWLCKLPVYLLGEERMLLHLPIDDGVMSQYVV